MLIKLSDGVLKDSRNISQVRRFEGLAEMKVEGRKQRMDTIVEEHLCAFWDWMPPTDELLTRRQNTLLTASSVSPNHFPLFGLVCPLVSLFSG